MTIDEAKKAFDAMKAQGATEEDILGTLYVLFQDDQIDVNELESLVNVLGYELTDDFKAMSPEDQKTKGYEETEEKAEGVTSKEVEEAKEYGDDSGEKTDDKKAEDKSDDSDDDESEENLDRLFGLKK